MLHPIRCCLVLFAVSGLMSLTSVVLILITRLISCYYCVSLSVSLDKVKFVDMSKKPLSGRILVSNSLVEADPSKLVIERPQYYCQWEDVSMIKALKAVEEEGMSVRHASELFGVPKSTLHDRVSGKVQHGAHPGPSAYLTKEEEDELARFLLRCADIGYPHTISQILAIVQQAIDLKGLKRTVTTGWWQRFSERHKEIALRSAVPLSTIRAKAMDNDSLNRYFDILEDTLKKNRIFNDPTVIYNCDETGMPLNPKGLKVVTHRRAKNVHSISGDTKMQITVLACVSASGTALPPMVIFDRKTLNPELIRGEIPETMYGLSEKGWINQELFTGWFYKHFLALIPKKRPVLLLMDGHSSHYCPEVVRLAAKEKVLLFTLPPHTTHLTQPLDRGCFSPLKTYWKELCHRFYVKNPGRVITRYDFSAIFSEAWKLAMTPKNIMSGFEVAGICPFSRRALDTPPPAGPKSLQEETGLAYIPLYSPARHYSDKSLSGCSTPRSDSNTSIPDDHDVSRATSVTQFLVTPMHPSKVPTKNPKSFGKVLTSKENMELMEEKERKKEEEKKEKERRKAEREEKAKQKKLNKKGQKNEVYTETPESMSILYASSMRHSLELEDDFTEKEWTIFTKRYENGYDLQGDDRYNLWLSQYHSQSLQKTPTGQRGRGRKIEETLTGQITVGRGKKVDETLTGQITVGRGKKVDETLTGRTTVGRGNKVDETLTGRTTVGRGNRVDETLTGRTTVGRGNRVDETLTGRTTVGRGKKVDETLTGRTTVGRGKKVDETLTGRTTVGRGNRVDETLTGRTTVGRGKKVDGQ
ncbi:PREDICTED: uncharacterized protein LOC109590340 isoform X7 [Amphimedon queenslandica]|uniref:HTH CENPB-type domain-containing protein n=1 Tax=Amphimedon queenslandica TaxID=400682 RepID=A0AAN0JXY4_AMPQE|nr:PREDICTED: uncharacterized protein LOC109590340 isoform X7 [Amphimedon queenslandica]|eukprot:XP_019861816.1 PREDICTED: uncharacterized protein LOC109590340 isoform X7 [Amphimedon queenslandica]